MPHVIGTAGHVDHGKSTLVEALTGIDPDRLAEEKAREMTIDLGFAWLTLPGGEPVGIVDVPGHRDFIENMLAGVGGIDLALLVIAADEGVMPQTREHLAILDLLKIPAGVVALTKTDLITDPDWLDLVTLDVGEVLKGSVLEDAPIMPVSARSGAGLDNLLATLEQALTGRPSQPDRGKARLPIDRVFTISGFGTVVTGTLTGGALHTGDEVEISPRGLNARIRGLQSHKEAVETATPGSRVAVNLTGVDKNEVQRGDVLAEPNLLQATTLIDTLFEYLPDMERPLTHNAEVKFFSGAAESLAHVRLIGDRELKPGMSGWLQIRLETPLALDRADRFILRYPSPAQTIGGGEILDAHPPHRWRRFKPEIIARFETLAAGSPTDLILQTLESQRVLSLEELGEAVGLPTDQVHETLEAMVANRDVVWLSDDALLATSGWTRLSEQIFQELDAYHLTFPLRAGMPREALRSRLKLNPRQFTSVIHAAREMGLLEAEEAIVRMLGYVPTFTDEQQARIDDLFRQIEADRLSTPHVKDVIALVGEEVYQLLVQQGRIVPISADVVYDAETYTWLVDEVRNLIHQKGALTVAGARDHFGTSRKYTLALLEHLDSIGVTIRQGDERVLK